MERILVVEDDPDVQGILKTILSKEGYEVNMAGTGREAFILAKESHPDLILTDFLMPGMNGVELCESLKKEINTKDIPIIMVTAYPSEKEKGLSAGAVDFVIKPIEKIDLLLRIRSALKVRHITNELQKIIAYIGELEKK